MGRFFISSVVLSLSSSLCFADQMLSQDDDLFEQELFKEELPKAKTPSKKQIKEEKASLTSFDEEFLDLFNENPSQTPSSKDSKTKKVTDQDTSNDMSQEAPPAQVMQQATSQMQTTATTSAPSDNYKIRWYYAFPDQQINVYAAIDYLYWTVSEPGMYYATTTSKPYPGEPPADFPVGVTSFGSGQLGKIQNQTLGWSSGVRGAFGYQFKHNLWNLNADYTYYNNSKKTTLYRPSGPYGYISGMNMNQATGIMVQNSESNIHFNYQNAKLMLGTPWVSFKPGKLQLLFGAHATWIEQKWNVNFYPYESTDPTNPAYQAYNSRHNSTWGVGLNATGKFDANLGRGFSFGVSGFVSALIGQQSLESQSSTTNGNSAYSNYYQDPTYQFMSQLMLSPQIAWSRVLKKASIRIEAAYEFNALLNMLDLYRDNQDYTADPQSGKSPTIQYNSLYLHGLTVRFSAGF
jgi:hypothetical protein